MYYFIYPICKLKILSEAKNVLVYDVSYFFTLIFDNEI